MESFSGPLLSLYKLQLMRVQNYFPLNIMMYNINYLLIGELLSHNKGLTICHMNETVTFLDGNLNPISNPTPPRTHPNWSGQPGVP
jgi:hypothetical protein